MGPGPIFCMRMFSFLQNGAWPHLFCLAPFILQIFPKTYASNIVISYFAFGNASNYSLVSAIFY